VVKHLATLTRHLGILTLGATGIANLLATTFCANYDPANPVTLGTALVVTILTVVDYAKNNGKN